MVQAERRSKQRFSELLPVSIGGESLGNTKDISATGAYLSLPSETLVEGDAVAFTLELPTDLALTAGVNVICRGRVLRVESADDQQAGVAVRIDSYDFIRNQQ